MWILTDYSLATCLLLGQAEFVGQSELSRTAKTERLDMIKRTLPSLFPIDSQPWCLCAASPARTYKRINNLIKKDKLSIISCLHPSQVSRRMSNLKSHL